MCEGVGAAVNGTGGSARSGKRRRPTLRGVRGRGFSSVLMMGIGLNGGDGRRIDELRNAGNGMGARVDWTPPALPV